MKKKGFPYILVGIVCLCGIALAIYKCMLCKLFFDSLYYITASRIFKEFALAANYYICTTGGGTDKKCSGLYLPLGKILLEVFPRKYFDSAYNCNACRLCNEFKIVRQTVQSYRERVFKNWTYHQEKIGNRKTSNLPPIRILQLTDVHFDPYYLQNYSLNCQELFCCRESTGLPTGLNDISGYWGASGRCDMPEHTIRQVFRYACSEIKPDAIAWLGDSVHGSFYNISKNSIKRILSEVTHMLDEECPGIPIVPILGNHDGMPIDSFNILNPEKEKWLLNHTATLWKNFNINLTQFLYAGYYSHTMKIRGTKLKFICLNSLLNQINNQYTMINSTDPLGQLAFLEQELIDAERTQTKAIILSHVPLCCDRTSEGFTMRAMVLLERYSESIVTVLAGHYHYNFFRVLLGASGQPFGFEILGPSLASSPGQNPGFNLLDLDPESVSITNIHKYSMDLEASNAQMRPILNYTNNYLSYYNISSINSQQLLTIVDRMKSDLIFYDKFLEYLLPNSKVVEELRKDGEQQRDVFVCLMTARSHGEFARCANFEFLSLWEEDMTMKMQNFQSYWETIEY